MVFLVNGLANVFYKINRVFAQPFRQPDLRIAARCCGRLRPTLDILESAMPFLPSERKALLAVKGIGPTVVARLEQMGYESLAHLSKANTLDIVSKASSIVGSTCWKNSPPARAAIQSAIALAQSQQAQMSNISSQPTACGGGG